MYKHSTMDTNYMYFKLNHIDKYIYFKNFYLHSSHTKYLYQ